MSEHYGKTTRTADLLQNNGEVVQQASEVRRLGVLVGIVGSLLSSPPAILFTLLASTPETYPVAETARTTASLVVPIIGITSAIIGTAISLRTIRRHEQQLAEFGELVQLVPNPDTVKRISVWRAFL